jgi:hypothetical protein
MFKRCLSFVAVAVIGLSSLVGQVEGVKFEMTARAYPETSELWLSSTIGSFSCGLNIMAGSLRNDAVSIRRVVCPSTDAMRSFSSIWRAHPCTPAQLYLINCSIWNFANAHTLVIVTANVSPGTSSPAGGQLDRIDVEIVDGSHKGNVYLAKKVSWPSLSVEVGLAVADCSE